MAGKEKEMLLVVSKVKEAIKTHEMRSGDEFLQELNECIHKVIEASVKRAKGNGRATLKAEDI